MRRIARLAAIATSAWLVAHGAHAQPRRPEPEAATRRRPPTTPLGSALDAARTTDYPRAERELLAIRGADQSKAALALARIMLEQGRFADAEKHATAAQRTDRASAAALKAEILFATGKVEEAIKLLDPLKDAPDVGGRRVRLMLGECLIAVGKRADAEPHLMRFSEDYNNDDIKQDDAEGLAMVGRAMQLLRRAKEANQAFNESEKVDKTRVETLLWRAELFLDKYDPGHAEEVLTEALKIAPKRADALVMMARVKLDQMLDFEEAEKLVKQVLAINPKHASAYVVKSGISLRDMDIQASDQAIDAGLAINPNHLELLSMRAATRFLADDTAGYERAKKETLTRNKEFSQFFGIVGEFAEWEHRYDDIVAMMKEAVQIDPKDGKAWAQLGMTQTRGGDEDAGKASLEEAWKHDHFNVRAFNTLEKLYKDWIPAKYEMGTYSNFKIRYPKEERALLERYVPRFVAQAWSSMKNRYGFVPSVPMQVELYGDRSHFSVRTSGLPNIGIQGVCFGRLIASMSPESEPFNWGNVVWHEIGHVFAIQLSKNHVPRWFTEGLSELETIHKRPEWQRELDPELYLALSKNVLPSAVDMNRAFTHASEGLDVSVAYYAASQMLIFTHERFGQGRINQALKLWGEGVRTGEVIKRAFGVSPKEYDDGFRAWAMARLGRYRGQYIFDAHPKPLDEAKAAAAKSPESAAAQVDLALSLVRVRKLDEAKKAIEAALKLDPAEKTAHFLAAKIAGGEKDADGQLRHLTAIQKAGGDGYAVQIALAEIADAKKDKAGMRAAYATAHKYDPSQPEPLKGLYDVAKEDKDEKGMLDALRKLAVLEQHDRSIWNMLLQKLVDAKQWQEAKQFGEAAIYVDVNSISMHVNYAKALSVVGDHATAAFELESAVLTEAKPKQFASAYVLLAKEYVTLRKPVEARKALAEARKLDPENAEAKALVVP